ncbi:hypothetical protein B0H14DRAFT_3699337 [Mycena olivaceomarginata]|nr:hypothetical protein B0H14DRAFT_3699337 [Mycena olivaceomarginata]
MDTSTVNAVNVSEALGKAQDLLKLFKKANAAAKTRLGGSAYKGALEERIAACERVIAESMINPQASTMSGSPNDLIHSTSGGNDQLNRAHGGPGPHSGGGLENVIDPNLANAPPAKKARTSYGQTHRKIVVEDPLDTVKESISAPMLGRFLGAWLEHGNAAEAADPTHTVAGFETLYDAAVEILDQVVHSAQQSQFSDEQFGWNIQYDGGDLKFSHLISLHAWLVANRLMVGNIQKKPAPAPQKPLKDHSDVTITHNGKWVKMTQKMLGDARMDPSMYPGCVEAGMDIIKEVLRNCNGRFKCNYLR